MHQCERHAGVRRMKQRALTLDHVPMIGRRIGREQFRRAGCKVRCHCVQRNAAARDQDSCLAGRAEVDGDTARTHRLGQGERGVFLAEGAVGSDSEQPLARPTSAAAGREGLSWQPHVDESYTAFVSRCRKSGHAFERPMHAAYDIQARGDRGVQHRFPLTRNLPADRCNADHERSRAGPRCLVRSHVGQSEIEPSLRQAQLGFAGIARPIVQAACGLGFCFVLSVADEQEIGLAQREQHGGSGRCSRHARSL